MSVLEVHVCENVQYTLGNGGVGVGGTSIYEETGPTEMCVSTLKGNGLVIYGHGLRKKKRQTSVR